jgi:hypothetical protein
MKCKNRSVVSMLLERLVAVWFPLDLSAVSEALDPETLLQRFKLFGHSENPV